MLFNLVSFASVLLLILYLSFAARERKILCVTLWLALTICNFVEPGRKGKTKIGKPSLSRAAPLRERKKRKTELAEKKERLVAVPLRILSCRSCIIRRRISIAWSRCDLDIISSTSKDVNPTKGTSQLSSCSLHSLIGQASWEKMLAHDQVMESVCELTWASTLG